MERADIVVSERKVKRREKHQAQAEQDDRRAFVLPRGPDDSAEKRPQATQHVQPRRQMQPIRQNYTRYDKDKEEKAGILPNHVPD